MYQFANLGHVREVHKQYIFWIIVRCLLFSTQFLTCFKYCKKEFPTYFFMKGNFMVAVLEKTKVIT